MKIMKRMIALVSTLAVVMTMVISSPVSAYATAPTKESVKYKGSGVVEVDFRQNVKYRKLKITVKDTSGKSYKVSNIIRDNDDVKFKIKSYKAGKTYKFTINGVRKVNTSKYGKVTGSVKIPKSTKTVAPTVESVKYKGSGVVEVDFHQKVRYRNPKITVKDTSGKTYKVSNIIRDDDDVKFKIKSYKTGKTYKFTIKGIRKVNASNYGSVASSVKIPKSTTVAAPTIESIEYKGSGVVEVDFRQKVKYRNLKITVKDTSGKSYNVSNVIKDDDDVRFKIKSYKTGKTYKFTITGICRTVSSKYVSISNSIKIPAKQTYISRAKARTIAINDAVKTYGIIESTIWDPSIESDFYRGTAIWEVDFEGEGSDGYWYELEYKINKKTGKIIIKKEEIEWDD